MAVLAKMSYQDWNIIWISKNHELKYPNTSFKGNIRWLLKKSELLRRENTKLLGWKISSGSAGRHLAAPMARRLWGAAYTVTAAILQLIIFKGNIYLFCLSSKILFWKQKLKSAFTPLSILHLGNWTAKQIKQKRWKIFPKNKLSMLKKNIVLGGWFCKDGIFYSHYF